MTPNPANFQQLDPIGRCGQANCTCESTAWLAAFVRGSHVTTGEAIRLASDEPSCNSASPGLNLHQADAALNRLTHGHIDLDVRTGYSMSDAVRKVEDGRVALVQINRGYLVDHGDAGANGFRGGHCDGWFYEDGIHKLFDPLVKHYIHSTPAVIGLAASHLVVDPSGDTPGVGRGNFAFSRDLTRDYFVEIRPGPDSPVQKFYKFKLASGGKQIQYRQEDATRGFQAKCTAPKTYRWKRPGQPDTYRSLVQLLEGSRKGAWVKTKWSNDA